MIRRYRVTLTLAALVGLGGCDIGNTPVVQNDKRLEAADITPKSTWRATSATMSDPDRAVDGKLSTTAVGPGGVGADLIIDMGRPCLFNRVAVDHGTTDDDAYPREMGMQTSMDGRTFIQLQRGIKPGTRRITNFTIITPTMARYIRLVVKQAGTGNWRIAEVYVQ